jgi:hypothetical protein
MSMTGTFQFAAGTAPRSCPDFNVFHRYAANYPWRSHAVWILTQMLRWGQLTETQNLHRIADKVYRPEIYREVAKALGFQTGIADYKDEGRHDSAWSPQGDDAPWVLGADCFFDGRQFRPGDPIGYLRGFDVHHLAADLGALGAANPAWPADDGDGVTTGFKTTTSLVGEAR